MASTKEIVDLAKKFKRNEITEDELGKLVLEMFWKKPDVNGIHYGDHRLLNINLPEDKQSQFCKDVMFMCWEDRCRGYGFIRSEFIFEHYFNLVNGTDPRDK